MDSAKGLASKLKLGKHHTADRLALNTSILLVAGVLAVGGAGAAAVSANQLVLGGKAVYTEAFSSSKTASQGVVHNLYKNEDGTRALLMMAMSDPETMSQDAGTYQAFVTGADPAMGQQTIKTEDVTGSLITFGSTGYIGLLLESPQPFETQILNATIRANNELIYTQEPNELEDDMKDDASFAEYDQWKMYFNPGASEAVHTPALDQNEISPGDIFYETVITNEERLIRGDLDNKLMEMRAALNRIEAEGEKLATTVAADLRLESPKVPELIDGDEVIGQPGTRLEKATKKAAAAESGEAEPAAESEEEGPAGEFDESELQGTGDDSTLELRTDTLVSGGYDFDWRAGNVREGYIEQIAQSDETLIQVVQRKADEAANDSGFDTTEVQWLLTDGTDLNTDYASIRDEALKPLVGIMNAMVKNWDEYYGLKSEYQLELPRQLVNLELQLRAAENSSIINTDEESVISY